ncbi:CaiB/BaiF CoA-transferase family protein [Snodgrassella sp. CFCC 13594]|uniref:CaiB/BaiF CoA transferase family protein n=1 Tax=Snodgrassella sp. CFCC 13594 TaxID=1775559 RepID=UPI001E3FB0DE|nr:CaiB/BaiF CoA-transferase family protein [Snodgrassella sp. CFCC 13594]
MGAEVIKIERPKMGDETRQWTPPTFADGTSAYFATVNRNKKSVTVDMASEQGQSILRRLAQDADIVVENFKVGGLAKYGLDYDSLKAINPGLIYASLTGFGQTGPDAHKPGYDYIIQGLSGLMSITGPEAGLPHKVGVAVVDLFAGLQLTIGIQAALLVRAQTGLGQHVDVALLDSALALTANVGMNCLASDQVPPRLGNAHPNIVPYQVFETAGSQHLILACGNDQQFAAVSQLMGAEWHLDERFATNPARVVHREQLIARMQPLMLSQNRNEWIALFESARIPCGPINNIAEALSMPQTKAREMVVDFAFSGSPVKVLGNPIRLSGSPIQYRLAPPMLGADTQSVLLSLGYDPSALAQWHRQGVI